FRRVLFRSGPAPPAAGPDPRPGGRRPGGRRPGRPLTHPTNAAAGPSAPRLFPAVLRLVPAGPAIDVAAAARGGGRPCAVPLFPTNGAFVGNGTREISRGPGGGAAPRPRPPPRPARPRPRAGRAAGRAPATGPAHRRRRGGRPPAPRRPRAVPGRG